jgi:putative nucleotidyltransferase with HDIG domain
MISYDSALGLLQRHGVHPRVIHHCIGVSEVAFDFALRVRANDPTLDINPEKVRIAGLLHDLGRCRPRLHEWHTLWILRNEGLGEIADIAMHGTPYERVLLLEGVEDESLLPQTIENKIVAYADLRFCQRPMSLTERLSDAVARKNASSDAVRIIRQAEERLFALEAEVLALVGIEPGEEEDEARAV